MVGILHSFSFVAKVFMVDFCVVAHAYL